MKKKLGYSSKRLYGRLAAIIAIPVFIAGCGAVQPVPYTDDELRERVEQDRQQMFTGHETISGPITFHQATARALKYNLDYRLKLLESALSKDLHDVSTHEMLPRLVANAGYSMRNNDSGGTSIGIEDRQESLRPSTSEERRRWRNDLTFSWSALDFGVSYYRAQQKADQVLMAEERRRKVAQNVIQDVRNSYWRALGAQRLVNEVNDLLHRSKEALEKAKQVEARGLMPKEQVLSYQRALLDAVSMLNLRRQDLELAKAELAALMSLEPGTSFTLADEDEQALPMVPTNMDNLELIALQKRPEIMEEWYRKRVTANDIKAAKLLLWPNLTIDAGPNWDTNKYTYNRHWMEAGLRMSWNVLKLTQLPALKRAHEHQNMTDDMRRMSLSMAVLTQVHIGVQRYELALEELKFAEENLRVDEGLLQYARSAQASRLESELEVIRAEARALLTRYQRFVAYSDAQAAWGRVYNSLGLDVLPETIDNHDVNTLAASIQETMKHWENEVFVATTQKAFSPQESVVENSTNQNTVSKTGEPQSVVYKTGHAPAGAAKASTPLEPAVLEWIEQSGINTPNLASL